MTVQAYSTPSASKQEKFNRGLWRQGDIIEVTVDALSNRGDGVGRWIDSNAQASVGTDADADGQKGHRVVFIPDAVPGDRLRVRLVRVKPSYAHGKLVNIVKPSSERIKPSCIVADKCGGCQWQSVNYERQLLAKYHEVCQCLERIGGFDASLVEPVEASTHLGYRNKVSYPLRQAESKAKVQAGYYQKGSHKLVNLNQCPVQDQRLNTFLTDLKEDIHTRNWSIYDEKRHQYSLRHLSLRVGRRTGEVLLTLVSRDKCLNGLEEQAKRWLQIYPNLAGVCLNINDQRTNAIFGQKTSTIAGRGYIEEIFADISFQIHSTTFFQVNTEQAEKLLRLVQKKLALTGTEKIVDAYCGIGTMTLPLAHQTGRMIGIEFHPASITQALKNAASNNIHNVGFHVGKTELLLPRLRDLAPGFGIPDVVMLDPPRKGCDRAVLETLRSLRPSRIVYISCNPATLARDLKILCAQESMGSESPSQAYYQLESVYPFDFFPQTSHVESVAFLALA
ncbi:MAG: 23S rRNA (uracil(1939)-C(5))-methyltransferase RlmD [Cyanobacteria bacterium P01_F01_bin.150]